MRRNVRVTGRRPTIGVLVPHVGGFYYANILWGIRRTARDRGARVVAFQTTGLDMLWPSEPKTPPLGWDCIDGWIGINDLAATEYYDRLLAEGLPFVTVSARVRGVCCLLPDNRGGIEHAVRHLIEHGHRRIGFVGGLRQTDLRERFEAYRAALLAAGVQPDPALFFPTNTTHEDDGRAVGRQLLALGLPCSALVAATDTNAIGVMRELQAAGRRVPEDMAIIGFDDVEQAQYAEPPLATVRVPFDVISARAAELLLAQLLDGVAPPESVRVPGALCPRQSCGCRSVPGEGMGAYVRAAEQDASAASEALAAALVDIVCHRLPNAGARRTFGAGVDAQLTAAARAIACHVDALVRREPAPAPAARHAWQDLLSAAHDVETIETLLLAIEQSTASRLAGGAAAGEHDAREAVRPLRYELMLAWRSVEQKRARYREATAQARRKIDLALIESDLAAAEGLSWLRWARVRHALLGEWRPAGAGGPARRLVVKSAFHAGPSLSIDGEHDPGRFPCEELVAAVDANAEDIVSVVPIAGRGGQNRGLLAVAGPIELEIDDDTGNLAQWAALLGAAIDRHELLGSLRHAAETLRRSEERYALAAHGANDGLWDWDQASGRLYVSPRWKAILGYGDEEIGLELDDWFSRVHPDDLPGLRRTIASRLEARQPHIEHEYRMAHKDGRWVWVLSRAVVAFDESGSAVRMAGSQTDITARKEAEEKLRRTALHDALTGLPNRTLLLDRLDAAIEGARTDARARFAVLFLDLDHFKTLNDSLGHLVGDQLLVQIAQRLCGCLRVNDMVARLGGDEFAILVADLESDVAAAMVADRVQDALRAPFQIGEHRVFTSASVGIALSSEHYGRAEDLLRDADTAMYRAKSQGRARHQLFDEHMHEQAMERLSVEAGLRRALERDELVLFYQPLVSLETGQIDHVEALIRWVHPEKGVLPPAAFLTVAEESGLILPISDWVLGTACAQVSRWRADLPAPTHVSVNVPPQQLKDPRLVENIEGHLRRAGLPASALCLELVESSLVESRGTTLANLKRLREMGVRIAVDDFGTGYSSLSYLKRLPIDALKIDRSFTQGIPSDPNDMAISTTIVAMARSLKLEVVAEGVETTEQVEFLRAHGCDTAQGYFFSRPLSADRCLAACRAMARATIVGHRGQVRAVSP